MGEVKTLVYCDLEATGLKSSGRPRITEISFVAVNMDNFLELSPYFRTQHPKNHIEVESCLPRVMNKLTVCLYPMATIRPEVSDITGLDNYNLSGQATFTKKTGDLLNSYLSHLLAPICLVAHNGDLYDFPLLKAEMEKARMTLPPGTLCADSYVGIKKSSEEEKKLRLKMLEVLSKVKLLMISLRCKALKIKKTTTKNVDIWRVKIQRLLPKACLSLDLSLKE